MGVNRIEFVKNMCAEHNKVLPANDEIPQTSISTDLRRFVLGLDDKPIVESKPKKSEVKKDGNKQKDKSNKETKE
jgi:hypothetical protein